MRTKETGPAFVVDMADSVQRRTGKVQNKFSLQPGAGVAGAETLSRIRHEERAVP